MLNLSARQHSAIYRLVQRVTQYASKWMKKDAAAHGSVEQQTADVGPLVSQGGHGRRLLIVYNPIAGRGRRHLLQAVIVALRMEGAEVIVRETELAGDAERLARDIEVRQVDAIIAAGGDGTVNEVINGLLSREEGDRVPALGVIPLGTTNVLALELALPLSVQSLAKTLAWDAPRSIYIGMANSRLFSLMVGVGFDASIVGRLNPALKRRIGKAAYVLQTLREIIDCPPRYYSVELNDGQTFDAVSVIIANGRYYGGHFSFARDACVERADLEVCLFLRQGRWSALLYALGLVTGLISYAPGYRIIRASKVVVRGQASDPVQGDGDVLTRLPLTVGICERPLSVIAPRAC